jgi:hypothetical protein
MSLRLGGSSLDAPAPAPMPIANMEALAGIRRAAGWFLTISILSGVNSLLQIFGTKVRFIFGLGITQVVDAMAHGRGDSAMILMIAVDGIFIGTLILCSIQARTGSQGAFLLGMILYALDGALLLYFQVWLDAAVHAYALFRIWQGYAAARVLAQAQSAAQPGQSEPSFP